MKFLKYCAYICIVGCGIGIQAMDTDVVLPELRIKFSLNNYERIELSAQDADGCEYGEARGYRSTDIPNTFHIAVVCVHDAADRGLGIGSLLMNNLLDAIKKKNFDKATIFAAGDNKLIQFYEKFGGKIVTQYPTGANMLFTWNSSDC